MFLLISTCKWWSREAQIPPRLGRHYMRSKLGMGLPRLFTDDIVQSTIPTGQSRRVGLIQISQGGRVGNFKAIYAVSSAYWWWWWWWWCCCCGRCCCCWLLLWYLMRRYWFNVAKVQLYPKQWLIQHGVWFLVLFRLAGFIHSEPSQSLLVTDWFQSVSNDYRHLRHPLGPCMVHLLTVDKSFDSSQSWHPQIFLVSTWKESHLALTLGHLTLSLKYPGFNAYLT